MSSFRQLMMREKGGGIEFKTAVVSTGNAYISVPLYQDVKRIDIEGTATNTEMYSKQTFVTTYYYYSGSYSYNGYGINCEIGTSAGQKAYKINLYSFSYGGSSTITTFPSSYSADFNVSVVFENAFNPVHLFRLAVAGKTKSVKIYNSNDVLLGEFLPAIVNGESGMYDTVGQQFYANANSVGSLVCE